MSKATAKLLAKMRKERMYELQIKLVGVRGVFKYLGTSEVKLEAQAAEINADDSTTTAKVIKLW